MSMVEFYYNCLMLDTSYTLEQYIKKYRWYFKKLHPDAQRQIKRLLANYRVKEQELYN